MRCCWWDSWSLAAGARPTIEGLDDEGQSGGPTKQDLQRILDRRAEAVRSRDEGAFLADLDQSNKELVQHEKMVFANLRQFRLTDFRYTLPDGSAFARDTGDGGSFAFPKVVEFVQLSTDTGPRGVSPAESFVYKVASKDGKLVVTDITPNTRANVNDSAVGNPNLFADSPWNTTPLKVVHVGNVWLAADDSVNDLERYADVAQSEVGELEALWGKRPRFPGYVLFLSRNKTSLGAWFSLAQDPLAADKEGVQVPRQGVRTNGEVYPDQYAGARIVVNLANIDYDDETHVSEVQAYCRLGTGKPYCKGMFADFGRQLLSGQPDLQKQAQDWAGQNVDSDSATVIGGVRLATSLDPPSISAVPAT